MRKKERIRTLSRSEVELTPELEEALAAEAENGYDLSKAIVQAVGRTSRDGHHGGWPKLSFRIEQAHYEAAVRRAEAEERPLSDLVREALIRYLDEVAERP